METITAEESAYQSIINMIIMHQLPPGSAVVELDMAHKLNMSRTPIRSALRKLTANGLLENAPNKGCHVPFLSRKDLDSLFNFRFAVESACAREAAMNYTDSFKDRIERLIHEEEKSLTGKGEPLHIINEKIHTLIAEISDNNYYMSPIKRVTWRCQLYLFFFDNFYIKHTKESNVSVPPSDFKSSSQHALLFDVIMEKNAEKAASLMKDHINNTYEMLTRNPWGN